MATLKVCIVGSGPAGFYATAQVLKRFGSRASVTLLDRLLTPYGLVRSGVAPDHQDTKNVINQFSRTGMDPCVSFYGNVRVGQDLSLGLLRRLHHAVILAHGAEGNRQLSIQGEGLGNVLSAREFVGWYNGHPDFAKLPVDLSKVRKVAVLGLGNVALDCARVLLQGHDRLSRTDVAEHALQQLRGSPVEQVSVIGRRGPVQAGFTGKELRELLNMPGIAVHIDPEQLGNLSAQDQQELQASRGKRRIFDLMAKAAAAARSGPWTGGEEGDRELRLRFLETPREVLDDGQGRASGLRLEENELASSPLGQWAVGTGRMNYLEADLVLASIGYRCLPMPGVAFDEATGTIANRAGRVLDEETGQPDPGLYVTGWAKRGPTGIIGTNLMDAQETVDALVADVAHLPEPNKDTLEEGFRQHRIQASTFQDWMRIDAAERRAGERHGRPRIKMTCPQMMWDLIGSSDLAGVG